MAIGNPKTDQKEIKKQEKEAKVPVAKTIDMAKHLGVKAQKGAK